MNDINLDITARVSTAFESMRILVNPYPADSNYCAFVVFAPNLHNFLFTHLCTSPQARFAEHNSCTFV